MDFAEDSETVSKSVYFDLNIEQDLCKASKYFISVIKASEPRKSREKIWSSFSCCVSNEFSNSIQEKDVRKWKEELLDQRRRMMEEKLLHAEFKREVQLQAIVKKAQEEEAKVSCFVLKGKYSTATFVYMFCTTGRSGVCCEG